MSRENKDVLIATLRGDLKMHQALQAMYQEQIKRLQDEIENLRTLFPKPESRWAEGVHVPEAAPDAKESVEGLMARAEEVWGNGDAPSTTVWLQKPAEKEAA